MTSIIKQLDSVTINKIAAGEVIDRPASIVKELIENALDANATTISITIKDGGKELIQITDNGKGFYKDDLPLAPIRHATSKIQHIDDVYTTDSFGFRGEALASVCHCSFLTITSKQIDQPAYSITAHQDKISKIQSAIHPVGTTITVENLFHNIPVRQRFLKSAATELAYIMDYCIQFSLINPDVSFVLIANGVEKLNTTGITDVYLLLIMLYGKDIKDKCVEVNETIGPVCFTGYISNPTLTFSNRSKQVVAVNGRLIKNSLITKAISDSFKDNIAHRRFPLVVLNLTVKNSLIDVNIHPQKQDIKFVNPGFLFDSLPKAIKLALAANTDHTDPLTDFIAPKEPSMATEHPNNTFNQSTPITTSSALPVQNYTPSKTTLTPYTISDRDTNHDKRPAIPKDYADKTIAAFTNSKQTHIDTTSPVVELPIATTTRPPAQPMDYLQIFDTYIILKTAQGAYLIDQHAVHERILYEKFKRNIKYDKSRQALLLSEVITLSMDQMTIFEDNQDYFTELNFVIESFGTNQIAIREIPVTFQKASVSELMLSIIEQLKSIPGSLRDITLDQKDMLQRKACRAAIKAGQKLQRPEIEQLLTDFVKSPQNYTCPHGRPLYILLDQHRLESMFLRK
tara:strand:- start:337 stop:2220 length:1884 start_codon:yes stop_codon:yes gene_type:complete